MLMQMPRIRPPHVAKAHKSDFRPKKSFFHAAWLGRVWAVARFEKLAVRKRFARQVVVKVVKKRFACQVVVKVVKKRFARQVVVKVVKQRSARQIVVKVVKKRPRLLLDPSLTF